MRVGTGKRFCRKCGAAIPPDSPENSCGACLLETGLDFDEALREEGGPASPRDDQHVRQNAFHRRRC